MGNRRKARRETRKKTKYGYYEVTLKSGSYHVTGTGEEERIFVGKDRSGRERAKALAAALDAAGVVQFERVLPPETNPSKNGESGEWQSWSADSYALPAKMLADSNYSAAGYLHGIYDLKPSQIARRIGVSEQSVRQYLSDLRAGRRSEDHTEKPADTPPEGETGGSNPTSEADKDGSGAADTAEGESKPDSHEDFDTALDLDWPEHSNSAFLEASFKAVGETRAYDLWNAGFQQYRDILEADVSDLAEARGVGEKTAEKIKIQMAGIAQSELGLEQTELADLETETLAETVCISEDLADRLKTEMSSGSLA